MCLVTNRRPKQSESTPTGVAGSGGGAGADYVSILSTGSAYGNHYTTEQVLDALVAQQKARGNDAFDATFAARVLAGCGFDAHSFALPPEDLFRRFARSEYLRHRRTNLVGLAERAGEAALARWGGDRGDITHLLWGTMTGALDSPTTDIELVWRLGLSPDVERTSIEGMGCLTGFRLTNLARQVAKGDKNARILVVEADLRSALGNSMPSNPSRADIVAACLFRDAASSAVIGSAASLTPSERPCYEIVAGASRIVQGTRHLVDYHETDDGSLRLCLDKEIPKRIGLAEPRFVSDLLAKGQRALSESGLQLPPIREMDVLCHTGGPRVLEAVADSLGISRDNMRSSWEVMTSHGNLSGASNLAVLDHHNGLAEDGTGAASEWALCLSMGPGVCLEGVLLRDVRRAGAAASDDLWSPMMPPIIAAPDTREVVHIVGGGIAGATLAAGLDPLRYKVRLFEATDEIRERGYGLAVHPSTVRILRDELGIEDLDLKRSRSMAVHSAGHRVEVRPHVEMRDRGFMRRSSLLHSILSKVEERHPGCVATGHRALRVRLEDDRARTDFETKDAAHPIVSHSCDLLVGADGVNSVVRRYVALENDSRQYGRMTAYRFLVPCPSKELLEETQDGKWNISVGDTIHSPMYHVSNDEDTLNVVVLEYDGRPPSHPRRATLAELREVARRSDLSLVTKIVRDEDIEDLMCYSTFHVDCRPWIQPNAVLIGDAAHAYGPLTAKMANLAINDAHGLAAILNRRRENGMSRREALEIWQSVQRPKFDVTRVRTLRHLQLYAPLGRIVRGVMWRILPASSLKYFGSIFAYDYKVLDSRNLTHEDGGSKGKGVVGLKHADPMVDYLRHCAFVVVCCLFILKLLLWVTQSI